jgi:hypothetical protein
MRAALLAMLLSLALALGASPALAHGHGGGLIAMRGVVTDVTSTSVQVQTQTASVTLALTARTHVNRLVSGSLADLARGQTVELHVIPGTSTVDFVRIEPANAHPHLEAFASMQRLSDGPRRQAAGPNGRGAAQILSISGSRLKVRYHSGQSATYTLSANVTITKVLTGRLGDLAVGEAVQLSLWRGSNTCATITILNT